MKKTIKVSVPGKLMFFGEHAVIYGRPCIVTAVDHRMRVLMELVSGEEIEINAPDVGIKNYVGNIADLRKANLPKGVRFVGTAINNFFKTYDVTSGLRVETKSDFSSEFGFGSSSAVTVGVIKALSELFGKKLTNQELFDLSYKTVLDVQGVGSGFDLAAAIWGGTIYFVTGGKKIVPLNIKELPLIVGYTGIKADTPTLVRKVAEFYKNQKKLVGIIFDTITSLTKEAREALKKSDMKRLGELMDINQGFLNTLGVNSKELSKLIFAAREGGAYGAKLSGAGGGDCMMALSSQRLKKKVEASIEKAGGAILRVKMNADGVKIEK